MLSFHDARVPYAAGALSPAFAPVGDAFAANFKEGLELGACFAAMIDGEMVVDLRGGFADRTKETPWTEETIACVFSSSKAVLKLLATREASAGRLDYDVPVSAYWPEFAQNGKEAITVAQMLSHQAGLCAFTEETPPEIWINWDAVAARLETMAPLWTPGTAHGYHPQTYGFLAGELLRRVSGRRVGAMVRDFDLQLYCGMKDEEMARAAVMLKPPRPPDLGELNQFRQAAFLKPWSAAARVRPKDWMAAEIPASNMHADARSLARALHPFVNDGRSHDGDPILSQGAIAAALRERSHGDDLVLPFRLSWAAGLMRNINHHFGPNENAYGHAGFGGSCVVIDPEKRLTAAYVMNKMSPYLVGDPRALRLINALYDCL